MTRPLRIAQVGPVATSIPPSGSSGLGAMRVQMTTDVGVGSPDATPSAKG